jgi:hypothetical protein
MNKEVQLPVGETYEKLAKLLEESAMFVAKEAPTNPMFQVHAKRLQDLQNYFFPKERECKYDTEDTEL